jgi:hypothetical protein
MAAISINQTPRRFEAGGTFVLSTAADVYTFFNHAPGSLEWTDAVATKIKYKDRGLVQVPLEGDNNYGSLKVTFHAGAYVAGILSTFRARNAAGATPTALSLVVKIPSYLGSTTGESLTWASGTIFVDGDFEVKHGGPDALDTISITFGTTAGPTIAAY